MILSRIPVEPGGAVPLFPGRGRLGRRRRGQVRQADSADVRHLEQFARERRGVEAYVEPPTTVSTTTVVFVAGTGEWTRRRVRDARAAHELANRLGIPSYDAAVVGYPQRMRDWNTRRSAGRPAPAPEAGDADG
jgi:hypothetical protein